MAKGKKGKAQRALRRQYREYKKPNRKSDLGPSDRESAMRQKADRVGAQRTPPRAQPRGG